MAIYSVYIVNKAGGLIYQHDHNASRPEVEKTFSYPLELVLKIFDDKIVVAFGERDGIKGKISFHPQILFIKYHYRYLASAVTAVLEPL